MAWNSLKWLKWFKGIKKVHNDSKQIKMLKMPQNSSKLFRMIQIGSTKKAQDDTKLVKMEHYCYNG